jgi:hypothetical protein
MNPLHLLKATHRFARLAFVRSEPATPATQVLAAHATWRAGNRRGQRLECLAGHLWITHDGDPKDLILAPGERYEVRSARPMFVSACNEAGARLQWMP